MSKSTALNATAALMRHFERFFLGLSIGVGFLLAGCASNAAVNHGFSFGPPSTNPGIKILDYQYGNYVGLPTQPSPDALVEGRVSQGTGTAGRFPLGEFLYVKWRILADGRVEQRRIDLRNRLPRKMEGQDVHFAFLGNELYVFTIDFGKAHKPGAPDCPAPGYEIFECSTIYPITQSNF